MQDVAVEEVQWLLYPFIPYGKITIIQGDPGEGKTTLVLQIIARLTKGEPIVNEAAKSACQYNLSNRRGWVVGYHQTSAVIR